MFFNVSDDLAMKNDPISTYIYTSVFLEDSHLAAWLVVLCPPPLIQKIFLKLTVRMRYVQ